MKCIGSPARSPLTFCLSRTRFSHGETPTMKVWDYALSALVAATDAAHHPRHHAAASYPTLGIDSARIPHAPREPVQTPSPTAPPSNLPAEAYYGLPSIKPRSLVSNNQTPDVSKVGRPLRLQLVFCTLQGLTIANHVQPMLGLYPEDQVTSETTTFENGIDSSKWVIDDRGYGGSTDNPFTRQMDPRNVEVADGVLKLKVPGGQKYDPKSTVGLSSAQIKSVKIFSVGSLEMSVKMSTEDGTCQCEFRGLDHAIGSGADFRRWFPLW